MIGLFSCESEITFVMNKDVYISGFVGFFECQLYRDVWMSIIPNRKNSGLFSWFPFFFPIDRIEDLKKGDVLSVKINRISENVVWYEWEYVVKSEGSVRFSKIFNLNGKTCSYGL